jgi:hypothetical protein
VSLLSHQILVWLAVPYYPYLAWFVAPLDLFGFKWDRNLMERFMSKSDPWGAKDLGRFFLTLSLLTYGMALLGTYFFMVVVSHNCGAHSGTNASAVLVTSVETTTWISVLHSIATHSWVLWSVVFLVLLGVLLLANARNALLEAVVDRQQRHQADTAMFGALVRRLRAQIGDLSHKGDR